MVSHPSRSPPSAASTLKTGISGGWVDPSATQQNPCRCWVLYQFFKIGLQMFLSTSLKERRLSGVEVEFHVQL